MLQDINKDPNKIGEEINSLLEKTLSGSKILEKDIAKQPVVKLASRYWKKLGPGLVTGAADDDPSGIATYSQAGAGFGFQLLWLASFTFPFMAVVQEMCARIGLETGRGLAGNIRIHFPKRILYLVTALLFAVNTLNLGVDLGAMAKAAQLILPSVHFGLLIVVFSLVSLFLEIFTSYRQYTRYLKYLALILFSYVLATLCIKLNWQQVLTQAIIPSITFSREQLFIICGILGTTISPYLFFWQTAQENEEEICFGRKTIKQRIGMTNQEKKDMRIDVWSGMFISNLIMFFIITATAGTLYFNGIRIINTPQEAALALQPLAGNLAYLLFSIGIIGTGFLTIPILAGASSYAIAETFRWKEGLWRKLKDAYAFYGVIIISTLIGLLINFLGIDPIKALLYTAVINGLVAPVILVLIVSISSNKKIMGENANSPFTTFLGWLIAGLMVASGAGAIVSIFG